MRNRWIMLLLAGVVACSGPAAKRVEISAAIENLTDEEVTVFYYKDMLLYAEEAVTVSVDEEGRFTAGLPLESGKFIYIRTSQLTVGLYALPGAKIHFGMNAQDLGMKPSISGEKINESLFLVDFSHDVETNLGYRQLMNKMVEMGPADFMRYVDSVHTIKLDYMKTHPMYENLHQEFTAIIETDIDYERYRLLLEYPMYYAYYNPLASKPDLPPNYYDFLEAAAGFGNSGFEENMQSGGFLNFLSAYSDYRIESYMDGVTDEQSYFDTYFMAGDKYFKGKSRDYTLAQGMIHVLNFESFELANARYEQYLRMTTPGDYRSMVAGEFRLIQSLAPGNQAPDFSGRDINGEVISVSDYRGQVVYLDFCASWCAPCLREMPHSKELKNKLAGQKDLVFMYVSIDTDEEAWRNMVGIQGIEGVHMNFPGTGTGAPLKYNVKGVPAFFIIGRDGRIYDNKAPRPSDPAIISALMTALLE